MDKSVVTASCGGTARDLRGAPSIRLNLKMFNGPAVPKGKQKPKGNLAGIFGN